MCNRMLLTSMNAPGLWSCRSSSSQVAQLTAENERLRSERDSACAGQANVDTEVERLWALVNLCTSDSQSQPESLRSWSMQKIIPSPSKTGLPR